MATHPITIDSAGGEYMDRVVILAWTVGPGDRVRKGDLVVTIETAKAATEIEAGQDGWLVEIFFAPGQEAPVGAILGMLADTQMDSPASTPPVGIVDAGAFSIPRIAASAGTATVPFAQHRIVASPLARRLARDAGLDLAGVTGTGPKGRIKQRDILVALEMAKTVSAVAPAAPALQCSRATPLLLLHGFGADHFAWRQVLPLLPPGLDVLALDLPGHGDAASTSVETIEGMALAISDRLEEAAIEHIHVAGHSLGGATALALAALGRTSVRSLTLLAPGGLGPEINGGFIDGIIRSTTLQALERWLAEMVGNAASLPPGYARAALRQMDKTGNRAALGALARHLFPDGTQGFDLQPVLDGLSVPARIIWGKADRIIPPMHAANAPGFAAVHLLSGIGHMPQIEAPALTARLIVQTILSAG